MIKSLRITNFRNFEKKEIEIGKNITIIVGENGTGKTNILEAISLLSTGKSFKAKYDREMINYDQNLARVSTNNVKTNTNLEVVITNGENGWPKKRFLVNAVPRRMVDFAGNIKSVLFGPWDMELVTESPSIRRNFLDSVLSQIDREYRRNIISYEKGLRQRNRLLTRIREEGVSRNQLVFWNQLLIKSGDYITNKRREFLDFVNSTENKFDDMAFEVLYDPSIISEGRLEQYKNEEIAAATTLVGPHRDDFIFNGKWKTKKDIWRELASYGSRGEQRMGVLWIKIAELKFISNDDDPILLLDDIFSELDHMHRDLVMDIIKNQQTIITTADKHFIGGFGKNKVRIINL